MSRGRTVLAVVAAQIALVGLYFAVECSRVEQPPLRREALDLPAPPLALSRQGAAITAPSEPHVVHFWATWCEPCREELPVLIEATRAAGVPLLAITDEPWPAVERYFDGEVPAAIALDPSGDAARTWGVSGLPDSFVVREGRVRARMGGPRDWSTDEARQLLRELRQ